MAGPHDAAKLLDILRGENVFPLVIVAVLADGACVLISSIFGASGSVYADILVSGIQFGQLSCLALWMALVAKYWTSKVATSLVVLAASCITLSYSGDAPRGVELATLLIIHVVGVWLTASGLRASGLLRTFDVPQEPSPQRFNLRQVFAWTTAFAILAFLSRFAKLPRGANLLELTLFLAAALAVAIVIAELVARVTPALQIPLSAVAVFAPALLVNGVAPASGRFEHFVTFYGIQAAVLLPWINASRSTRSSWMRSARITVTLDDGLLHRLDQLVDERRFASHTRIVQEAVREKLDRLDRSRLARECSKLDPAEEQHLAEEGLADDFETRPDF